MKKLTILVLVAMLLPVTAMAADITTSHSQQFGCGACHSAHTKTAAPAESAAPLWGRTLTTETLSAYNSGSGTVGDDITPGTPAADSMMCMSCHDGVSNSSGVGAVGTTKTEGKVDTSLTHPISFVYTGQVDTGNFNATPTNNIMLKGTSSNRVECSTCHDIHGDSAGSTYALRATSVENTCLGCHIK